MAAGHKRRRRRFPAKRKRPTVKWFGGRERDGSVRVARRRHNHFVRRVADRYGLELTIRDARRLEEQLGCRNDGSEIVMISGVRVRVHWRDGILTTAFDLPEDGDAE